jgi:GTP-binding protein
MAYIPTVAIIGRPNVGKSTFFNRIIGKRIAIVDDESGITRDRHYFQSDWAGYTFNLVDTGGLVPLTSDSMELAIKEQALIAIDESDVIIFLVDGEVPPTSEDKNIAKLLYNSEKPVIVAVNKIDNEERELGIYDYYQLGLGEPYPVSALHGRKSGDLLDVIVDRLDKGNFYREEEDDSIKLAVIGRPNVGKSSFVNAILGKNQNIVTDMPGTTRDTIDTKFKRYGEEYTIIDTAGLRKKPKSLSEKGIEYYSALRTVRAIHNSHVAIVVIDGAEGVQKQDVKIAAYAHENHRALILALNKWDLVVKDEKTMNEYREIIYERMPFADYAPIVFISALTRQRTFKVIDVSKEIYQQWNRRVKTSELNEVVQAATTHYPPPSVGGKFSKIYYATQVRTAPPTFVFFTKFPYSVPESYKRYLSNQLRRAFNFVGTPIRLIFRGHQGRGR